MSNRTSKCVQAVCAHFDMTHADLQHTLQMDEHEFADFAHQSLDPSAMPLTSPSMIGYFANENLVNKRSQVRTVAHQIGQLHVHLGSEDEVKFFLHCPRLHWGGKSLAHKARAASTLPEYNGLQDVIDYLETYLDNLANATA